MSGPDSSHPSDPNRNVVVDATVMDQAGQVAVEPPSDDRTLVITDLSSVPEHTLAVPPEQVEATIADSPGEGATFIESQPAVDDGATQNLSATGVSHAESAVQTLIGEPSHDPHATFAEIQATAGSSSVARGWAQTKGATGGNWSEQNRATQPNAVPPTNNPPRMVHPRFKQTSHSD